MKTPFAIASVLVLGLSVPTAYAGSIAGVVTSSKEVKESQSSVVVWVEGLPATAAESTKPVMSQSGVQFSPRVLTVVAGQTVDFPNEDDVAHNVFSMSQAKKFKLGIYPKGESREVTFEKPGVIDLFCSIHRHMHAVIVVTPSERFAQTTLGESFTIENVPPGTYTLHVWNPSHKLATVDVTVGESEPADLKFQFSE